MTKVDLIVPTLKRKGYEKSIETAREYMPFDLTIHEAVDGKSWPEAVNLALEKTTNDVILMDDDVEILPNTFKGFWKYYPSADIFGFKLCFPNGLIQHGGAWVEGRNIGHLGHSEPDEGQCDKPLYVCHVTASLMYITRPVVDDLKRMSVWDGAQFEDVDFNFRALKKGYKVLYLPMKAIHRETATKRNDPLIHQKMNMNYMRLRHLYMADADFLKVLEAYPEPLV